jgi:hypothetical protein
VVQALLPILHAFVDAEAAKGVDATYERAVHGGPGVTARFRDATASIGPPDSGIAGCCLSGDSGRLVASPLRQSRLGRAPTDGPGNGDRR